MGSDGVFSSAVFPKDTGIACERQFEAGGLDLGPLVIEDKKFESLVVEGLGFRIKNRSDHVTRYYPQAAVAIDELPMRSSTTMIAPNVPEGAFWAGQSGRRAKILAKAGVAYIAHFSQEPAPTAEDLAAARAYVEANRDNPAEPEPAKSATYERSLVANQGLAYDPGVGVGVRIRQAGVDTSEADEAARLTRINAAPMYGPDGEPIIIKEE